MKEWVIILIIYFADAGRVDTVVTDLTFKDPLSCNEFRLSKEFQNKLTFDYKSYTPPVLYVRPICRPYKKEELYACSKCIVEWETHNVYNNGSKGICSMSPCVWQ
jgi:hypothetical protein